jgi:hypothetical protein
MTWFWSWLLVLGAVTLVGGVLASRAHGGNPRPPIPATRVLLGLLLALIAFALCLPSRVPFARGMELGYGVLFGLAAAVIAVAARGLARPSEGYASTAAAAAAMGGAAVVCIAAVEIVFRANPGYALLGSLAGGLLVLLPSAWQREEMEVKAFTGALLIAGLGALLATARYTVAAERVFWPLPVVPLAAGLLGLVLGALLFGRAVWARWATPGLVVALEAAAWLGSRTMIARQEHVSIPPQFGSLLLLGWAAFILIALSDRPDRDRPFVRIAPPLLAVIALIIAFNIAGGYGTALMLAAGLPLALALWRQNGASAPFWAIALAILFLAYRLYLSQFQDDFRSPQTLEFGRHYVFLGLAAGLLWIGSARYLRASLGGLVAQLAGLALLPAVLFMAFGHEALLGLILGLFVAQLILPMSALSLRNGSAAGEWAWPGAPSILLPLVTVWALIIPNWAGFMLDQPRSTRGLVVGVAAALALIALARPGGTRRGRAQGAPEAHPTGPDGG